MGTLRQAYSSVSASGDVVRTCDQCRRTYRIQIQTSGWASVTAGREAASVARESAEYKANTRLFERKRDPRCAALCPHCGQFSKVVIGRYFRRGMKRGVHAFLRTQASIQIARVVGALIIPLSLIAGILYVLLTQPFLPAGSNAPDHQSSPGMAIAITIMVGVPMLILMTIGLVQLFHFLKALRTMAKLRNWEDRRAYAVARTAYSRSGFFFDAAFRRELVKVILNDEIDSQTG